MDKSMIREALELAIVACSSPSSKEQYDAAHDACQRTLAELDKPGEGDPDAHLSDEDYLKAKQDRFAKGGLANVDPDKYMEEVRGTGKWISVDERLPELKYLVDQEGGRRSDAVLVYPNGSLGSVAYCYQKPGFDPRWYAIISVPAGYVTHWMPLPSAPASTNT